MARVAVIGAGIVGASCGYFLARDGHDVTVLDRAPVGGGTTSRGEGNVLVSDKEPGPELDLALWSVELWRALGADLGVDDMELETKGGLVVAAGADAMTGLGAFAERQASAGVQCRAVGGDGVRGGGCVPGRVGVACRAGACAGGGRCVFHDDPLVLVARVVRAVTDGSGPGW